MGYGQLFVFHRCMYLSAVGLELHVESCAKTWSGVYLVRYDVSEMPGNFAVTIVERAGFFTDCYYCRRL